MHKRIIILLFIIFFTIVLSVSAQQNNGNIDSPTEKDVDLLGQDQTCGYAGVDGYDACCFVPECVPKKLPDVANTIIDKGSGIPLIGGVVSSLGSWVRGWEQGEVAKCILENKYKDPPCQVGEPSEAGVNCKCIYPESEAETVTAKLCFEVYEKQFDVPAIGGGAVGQRGPMAPNRISPEVEMELKKSIENCVKCGNSYDHGGYFSGLGCIPLTMSDFLSDWLLSAGIGIGGGLALLCIIYSAIRLQSSRGNPEKLNKIKENLTSCIIGLLLIIFSIFILRLIGINILGLPGL